MNVASNILIATKIITRHLLPYLQAPNSDAPSSYPFLQQHRKRHEKLPSCGMPQHNQALQHIYLMPTQSVLAMSLGYNELHERDIHVCLATFQSSPNILLHVLFLVPLESIETGPYCTLLPNIHLLMNL